MSDSIGMNEFLTHFGTKEEIKRWLKANDKVMKDACEFYGISPERYFKITRGIMDVEDLKKGGVEITCQPVNIAKDAKCATIPKLPEGGEFKRGITWRKT